MVANKIKYAVIAHKDGNVDLTIYQNSIFTTIKLTQQEAIQLAQKLNPSGQSLSQSEQRSPLRVWDDLSGSSK